MISLTLFGLAVLWIAVLRRYPAYFVPRKPAAAATGSPDLGENWIEVAPSPAHYAAAPMQQVA